MLTIKPKLTAGYPRFLQGHNGLVHGHQRDCGAFCTVRGGEGETDRREEQRHAD